MRSGTVRGARRVVLVAWIGFLAVGCDPTEPAGPVPPPPPPPATEPLAPDLLNDGWPVTTLSQANIDYVPIVALADLIRQARYGVVHALLIARQGRLAYEGYFSGFSRGMPHTLQSVTKSVGSALIGIAVDRGLIRLEETLDHLLPARAAAFDADPAKRAIRLQDLLSMEVGLDWDEQTCPYTQPCNDGYRMNQSADWVGYLLSKPAIELPGFRFVYNSGASNTLAAVLRQATDEDPVAFARRELFTPLGIDTLVWFRNSAHADTLPHFGGGLQLRGRDLLKFGQLFLDRGVWKGQRILSADWVARTGSVHATVGGNDRYGLQWWLRPMEGRPGHVPSETDMVYGWGFGGQHVFVIGALDLVVVFFGGNVDGSSRGHAMLDTWIIPAVH